MTVAAILRSKGNRVMTVEPDCSVGAAARELRAERIGALVVTSDGGHVDGIISERDIVYAIAGRGPEVLDLPVRELMSTETRTCRLEDSVQDLMETMTRHRVRHIPVLDEEGRLAGIVSIGDVVKRRLDDLQRERDAMFDYVAGR